MNDDSIAKHMYCHVLSVLLTGQKKKKKKKKKNTEILNTLPGIENFGPLFMIME